MAGYQPDKAAAPCSGPLQAWWAEGHCFMLLPIHPFAALLLKTHLFCRVFWP